MKERVYIIDYDVLSPIGLNRDDLRENLYNNVKGESKVSNFETDGIPFKIAAEIKKDLKFLYRNEEQFIKDVCISDRKFELTIALANLVESRFKNIIGDCNPNRRGVVMGVGSDVIMFEQFEKEITSTVKDTTYQFNDLIMNLSSRIENMGLMNPYDIHAIYISEMFDLRAFQKSTLSACTSSTQAISIAFDSIRNGKADIVFAGGTDSIINTMALISFGKLGVIPESGPHDEKTCKPFDIGRKGTLAGESAGIAILASETFIKKSKIKPLAEIVSIGNTLDGYKITAPDPSGDSMEVAISTALKNGKVLPGEIDYINAHGTGTKQNDGVELAVINRVFGDYGKEVPISSTKDRHGHAIAAAGIQELAVLLTGMKNDFIPSNMNLVNPIDDSFNLVRENSRKKIKYALSNNFAFGGVNTVFILKNIE